MPPSETPKTAEILEKEVLLARSESDGNAEKTSSAPALVVATASQLAETTLPAATAAEIAASAGGGSSIVIGVMAYTGLALFALSLYADKKDIDRLIAKINRRKNRLEQLRAIHKDPSNSPEQNKKKALALLQSKNFTTADLLSPTISSAATGLTTISLAAVPLDLLMRLTEAATGGLGLGITSLLYFLNWWAERQYKKLQATAEKLKQEELAIYQELGLTADNEQKYEENWALLPEIAQKTILDLEKISKKEFFSIGAISAIYGALTGLTIYAIIISFSSLAVVAALSTWILFPAIALGAAALAGIFAYTAIKKINTEIDHCFNKIRSLLGLPAIDEKPTSRSAVAFIRTCSLVLCVLAFLTFPVIGWGTAGALAGGFVLCNILATLCTSYKSAQRKNFTRQVKDFFRTQKSSIPHQNDMKSLVTDKKTKPQSIAHINEELQKNSAKLTVKTAEQSAKTAVSVPAYFQQPSVWATFFGKSCTTDIPLALEDTNVSLPR